MTIYTKKNGKYVALTKDQIHRMQRRDHVLVLQKRSLLLANTMVAFIGWLDALDKKNMTLKDEDAVVAQLPNRKRLFQQVVGVKEAMHVLQKGEGRGQPASKS